MDVEQRRYQAASNLVELVNAVHKGIGDRRYWNRLANDFFRSINWPAEGK